MEVWSDLAPPLAVEHWRRKVRKAGKTIEMEIVIGVIQCSEKLTAKGRRAQLIRRKITGA